MPEQTIAIERRATADPVRLAQWAELWRRLLTASPDDQRQDAPTGRDDTVRPQEAA